MAICGNGTKSEQKSVMAKEIMLWLVSSQNHSPVAAVLALPIMVQSPAESAFNVPFAYPVSKDCSHLGP